MTIILRRDTVETLRNDDKIDQNFLPKIYQRTTFLKTEVYEFEKMEEIYGVTYPIYMFKFERSHEDGKTYGN